MATGEDVFSMMTLKGVFPMVALAAAACQPASRLEIGIPQARSIAYEAIRDDSGVLGYAESLRGPAGPGNSLVETSMVAGAWELPLGTQPEDLAQMLRARGDLDRIRDNSDGQLWIADYQARGQPPVRLLLINGAHPLFETRAVPEVRPGPHVYLIAYWKP